MYDELNAKDYIKLVGQAKNNINGCVYREVGWTEDMPLYVVFGWCANYDPKDDVDIEYIKRVVNDTEYTLCYKLAFNISGSRNDYGRDWIVPWWPENESDVYKVEQAAQLATAEDEAAYINYETQEIIHLIQGAELAIE